MEYNPKEMEQIMYYLDKEQVKINLYAKYKTMEQFAEAAGVNCSGLARWFRYTGGTKTDYLLKLKKAGVLDNVKICKRVLTRSEFEVKLEEVG